jgi:biopolymer transport protein ExbB/TolQ
LMPGVCLNSWQTDGCEWSIGYLWRSSDWVERLFLVALALMLAYAVFVFSRFFCRCYSARRQSRALVPDSTRAFQRSQRRLVAKLSRGLGTLKSIASIAPFLGLAGTCYGILGGLFRGIGMEKRAALAMITANIAAA